MPAGTGTTKGGTGNPWADTGIILAGGLGGYGNDVTNVNTNGTSETNQVSTANNNYYNNTNTSAASTSWLDTLLNAIQQMQGSSTTGYNLDPSTQLLLNKLISSYSNLTTPFNAKAYEAGQIQGINANSDIAKQAVQQVMAARGVSGPAAATAEAGVDQNRINQITQMQEGIPQLANQWNLGNLGAAANFFQMIPKGTTTTQQQTNTSSQQGSQTQGSQNVSQTGTTGGSDSYAQNWNKTTNQTQQQQRKEGGLLKGLAGIASTAASLFSDKRLKKEIQQIDRGDILDRVMKLNPVSWRWKEDNEKTVGLIAQDLKKVMPELVHKDDESGKYKVNYAGLLSELVGAVQAIGEKVEVV